MESYSILTSVLSVSVGFTLFILLLSIYIGILEEVGFSWLFLPFFLSVFASFLFFRYDIVFPAIILVAITILFAFHHKGFIDVITRPIIPVISTLCLLSALAGGEYLVRALLSADDTSLLDTIPPAILLSLLTGILYSILLLTVISEPQVVLGGFGDPSLPLPSRITLNIYVISGTILTMAVPVGLLLHGRFLLPIILIFIEVAFFLQEPGSSDFGAPLSFLIWPIYLVAFFLLAGLEYIFRMKFNIAPL
jgi:hypothetical protein